jgi:hypothetical protein
MQGYSVLMPARPGLRLDDVADTIDSVLHFTGPETQLFLLDDTAGRDYQSLAERFSRVHLGATHFHDFTEVKPSSCGPLAVKQLRALEIIRNRQQSAVVLRLDTDALILGPNAFLDAQAIFGRNPAIGGLGAFTIPGNGSSKTEAMAGRRDDPVPVLRLRKTIVRQPAQLGLARELKRLLDARARTATRRASPAPQGASSGGAQ